MINKKTLSLGSAGAEVESLQELLTGMGYSVRSSGKFDDFTRQALMDVQNKAGLTITGVLDADTRTVLEGLGLNATSINEPASARLKLIQAARGLPTTGFIDEATLESLEGRISPDNYYIVSGTVYGPDGEPRSDVVVSVYLKGIKANDLYKPEQKDLLSVSASGRKRFSPKDAGQYRIGFSVKDSASSSRAARFSRRKQINGGLDLIVDVHQKTRRGAGRRIGQGLILNANRNETLDIIVQDGKGSQKDTSEYFRLKRTVSPMVVSADLEWGGLLTSEVAHLSTLCDFSSKSIAIASVAHKNENSSLWPVYYGLASLEIISNWDELFSLKPDLLGSSLELAIERNLISIADIKDCSTVDDVVDLVLDLAAEIRLETYSDDLFSSPSEMFEALNVEQALRKPFLKSYLSYGGSAASFWTEVLPDVEVGDNNEKPFTAQVIEDLQEVVTLSAFTRNHTGAASLIKTDGRELVALARLSEFDWQTLLPEGTFEPGDGTTASDEQIAFISDIRDRLWAKFPTARFQVECRVAADEVDAPANVKYLAEFLELNTEELGAMSIPEYLGVNEKLPENLREAAVNPNKELELAQLRKDLLESQRLIHVTSSFEAIKEFRVGGLISSQDIAMMDANAFAQEYGPVFSNALDEGISEALAVHRKARSVAATVAGMFAVSRPGFVPNVISSDNLSENDIASIESLFGTQDYLDIEPARSLYSPAAYLVDLLKFLKTNDCLGADGDAETLADVRPDILDLPLDKANTETLIPCIDLVNERLEYAAAEIIGLSSLGSLEKRISPEDGSELLVTPQYRIDGVYENLAQRMKPRLLPFDLANEQARRFLPLVGTNREEIHQKIPTLGPSLQDTPDELSWAADFLGIFPAECEKLTDSESGYDATCAWLPVPSNSEPLSVREFLDLTGMTFTDLEDFLATPFAQGHSLGLKTTGAQWELDLVYLVKGPVILGSYGTIAEGTILEMDTFLRIWRHLGWTLEQVSRLWTAISSVNSAPARAEIATNLIIHAAGIVRIAQRLNTDVSSVIDVVVGLSQTKQQYTRNDDSDDDDGVNVDVAVGPTVPDFEFNFDSIFVHGVNELDEATFRPFEVTYDSGVPVLDNHSLSFRELSTGLTTVLRLPEASIRSIVTDLFGVDGVTLNAETEVPQDVYTLVKTYSVSRLSKLIGRDVTEVLRLTKAFPDDLNETENDGLVYNPTKLIALLDRFDELESHDLDVGDACLFTGVEDGGRCVSDLESNFAKNIWKAVSTEFARTPEAVVPDTVDPVEALNTGLECCIHGAAVWESYSTVLSPEVPDPIPDPIPEIDGLEFLETTAERNTFLTTTDEDERIAFVIEKLTEAMGISALDTDGWNSRIALLRQLRGWERYKEIQLVSNKVEVAYGRILTVQDSSYVPGDELPFLSSNAIDQLFAHVGDPLAPLLDEEDERIACALTELAAALEIEDEVPENTTSARYLYSLLDLYFASNDQVRVAAAIVADPTCIEGRTLSESERTALLPFVPAGTVSDFQSADVEVYSESNAAQLTRIGQAVIWLSDYLNQSSIGLGRGIDWYEQHLTEYLQILSDELDIEEAVKLIEGVSKLEGQDLTDVWDDITALVSGLDETVLSGLAYGSDPTFPEVRCGEALQLVQGVVLDVFVNKFPLPTGADSSSILEYIRNVDEYPSDALIDLITSEEPNAVGLVALVGDANVSSLANLSDTQMYGSTAIQTSDIRLAREALVFQAIFSRVTTLSDACVTSTVEGLGVDTDTGRAILDIFPNAQLTIGNFFLSVVKEELSAETLSESVQNIFLRLQKLAFVTEILGIKPADIEWLSKTGYIPADWGTESEETFAPTARDVLKDLITYADLKKMVTAGIGSAEKKTKAVNRLWDFIELAMAETATAQELVESCWAAMVDETGQSPDLSVVSSAFDATGYSSTWFGGLESLHSLVRCIDFSSDLGIDAVRLKGWGAPTLTTDDPWMSVADDIRNHAISRVDKDDWTTVVKPIQDGLRTAQRDALVSYIVSELDSENIKDADDLYRYLLIDVQMGAKQLTSRVKSAILSIQLYVQKIQQGLGPDSVSTLNESARKKWEWKKHYRVWEANRKVFLYPENWLYPEDRDDKTPFFEELENELQQGEITDELAEAAFRNYLEKLDLVSKLEIVGVCQETVEDDYGKVEEVVEHVIGRTRNMPRKHYHRERRGIIWSAWEEINVQIDSDYVLPTIFNNRLHIFWPVITTRPSSDKSNLSEDTPAAKNLFVQMAWTKLQNGKWTSKQQTEIGATVGKAVTTTDSNSCMPDDGRSRLAFAIAHDDEDRLMVVCHYLWKGIDVSILEGISAFSDQYSEKIVGYFTRNFFIFDPADMSVVVRNDGKCDWARDVPGADNGSIVGQYGPKISTGVDGVMVSRQSPAAWEMKGSFAEAGKLGWELLYKKIYADESWVGSIIAPSDRRLASVPFTFQDNKVTILATPTFWWTSRPESADEVQTASFAAGTAVPIIHPTVFEGFCSAPTISFAASTAAIAAAQRTSGMYSNRGWGAAGSALKRSLITSAPSGVVEISDDSALAANILTSKAVNQSTEMKALFVKQVSAGVPEIHLNDTATWRKMQAIQNQVSAEVLSIGAILSVSDVHVSKMFPYKYRVESFQHDFSNRFVRNLALKGLDGLLSRDTQIVDTGVWILNNGVYIQGNHLFKEDLVLSESNLPTFDIDFGVDQPYAQYNWEVFFHIPLYIAKQLMQNQRFEEAQKWFHFIFDPLHRQAEGSSESPQKYWNVRPFFDHSWTPWRVQDLRAMLRDHQDTSSDSASLRESLLKQIEVWQQDPFSPHLIARLRPVAYQMNVVMSYIENLMAWGDQLFRQDTMESINEATLMYVLAAEILGRRPTLVTDRAQTDTHSYNELGDVDEFGNADVMIENILYETPLLVFSNKNPDKNLYISETGYFGVPKNDQLWGLWDTVADRLFKIRHSLNIEGVERTLALFEPPIDPALLVKATAAGISVADLMNERASSQRPLHRFRYTLNKAMEFAQDVKSLGQSFLAAYEKRDAEEIARLRANQEVAVLTSAIDVRKMQLEEAEANLKALSHSQETALLRRDWYKERISEGPAAVAPALREREQLKRIDDASMASLCASQAEMMASMLGLIPDFDTGVSFGAHATVVFGGKALATVAHAVGTAFQTAATISHNESSKAGILAGWGRRLQEWKHQADMAQRDYDQIGKQIEGANLRVAIAKRELKNLEDLQVKNAEAIQERQALKFTNKELYDWMVTELSKVYFSSFDLAYRMARKAQQSYEMEIGDSTSFIKPGYWDSLRKGLLAGERLFNDLRRIDASYLEKNAREYELTRSISIAQLDPAALISLRSTGECYIDVPEALFDLDHPGHYMRRIKTVSLSVPCTVGPFSGVNATLSLIKNSTRMNSGLSNDQYRRAPSGDNRFIDDSRTISIATSGSINDAGLFEVNLHDERYLPFELAGAVSTWRLQIPAMCNRFDLETITDVILKLQYTAREGGEQLRKKALSEVVEPMFKEGVRMFALKAENPDQWQLLDDTNEFAFTVSSHDFPGSSNASDIVVKSVAVYSIGHPEGLEFDITLPDDTTVTDLFDNAPAADVSRAVVAGVENKSVLGEWQFTCDEGATLPQELIVVLSYKLVNSGS